RWILPIQFSWWSPARRVCGCEWCRFGGSPSEGCRDDGRIRAFEAILSIGPAPIVGRERASGARGYVGVDPLLDVARLAFRGTPRAGENLETTDAFELFFFHGRLSFHQWTVVVSALFE